MRYCEGLVAGMAVGSLAAALMAVALDPRLNRKAMSKGRYALRAARRTWNKAKSML